MTIRDIPDEVRDALAARAARAGQSLQEHLRAQLIALAQQPTMSELMARIRERKTATASNVTTDLILKMRDEERR